MRFLKKELKIMENIEEECKKFREPTEIPEFRELQEHPKKLRKAVDKFKRDYFVWREGDKIGYSGGMRMFLFICAVLHNNDRQKYLLDIIRQRHWQQLLEFKIIDEREKNLGIRFKAINVAQGLKNFDDVEIIGEEI